jgi:hypothetical protein
MGAGFVDAVELGGVSVLFGESVLFFELLLFLRAQGGRSVCCGGGGGVGPG